MPPLFTAHTIYRKGEQDNNRLSEQHFRKAGNHQGDPIRFNDLVLEGKLWTYLADLNEQAQNRLQLIIRQMQEAESVNDELKEKNQMAWVQAVNSIHNRAEEIVLHELVSGENA